MDVTDGRDVTDGLSADGEAVGLSLDDNSVATVPDGVGAAGAAAVAVAVAPDMASRPAQRLRQMVRAHRDLDMITIVNYAYDIRELN
ncbi:hypothetical protein ABZ746_35130 [Streptomyces sp. NPDC020096]